MWKSDSMDIIYHTLTDAEFAGKSIFHPKAALKTDGKLLLTFQEILGSDYYGPVKSIESSDNGYSWGSAAVIPGLGELEKNDGIIERHCDTVPDLDPASGRIVAIGHNAFSKKSGFLDTLGYFNASERRTDLMRRGAYCVQREDGSWGPRHLLEIKEFAQWTSLCCGCTQKIIRNNGEWLIPFGGLDDPSRHIDGVVVVGKFEFDGEEFHCREVGEPLVYPVKRGLLEPSLIEYNGKIFVTMRAEDEHAHYAVSDDGLHWGAVNTWEFDDNTPLITGTTQQHFLISNGKLHLVYTRRNEYNGNVFRYRAPLYIAEVDVAAMKLIRDSERTVFPFDGDPRHPETVALSGNFHVTMLPDGKALVTDAACKVYKNYESITMISYIDA